MAQGLANELGTTRLRLCPIVEEDAEALHELWTDKEVRRYLWDNRIIPIGTVRTIIQDSADNFSSCGSGMFSLRLKSEPEKIVGFCGNRPFEGSEDIELLYGVHPEYWNRGLGTEAARRVLEHGIKGCGFDRVIAATDTPNQRSVKVMQRLGMVFDRRQKHHGLDTVFYSICADDFARLRHHG